MNLNSQVTKLEQQSPTFTAVAGEFGWANL
jgi:hypothetical protein